jgi:hypothetical protein
MLNKHRLYLNVLNEVFFELFVKSNQGIREFCETRNLNIEEVKDILFRRETPSLERLTQLINLSKI